MRSQSYTVFEAFVACCRTCGLQHKNLLSCCGVPRTAKASQQQQLGLNLLAAWCAAVAAVAACLVAAAAARAELAQTPPGPLLLVPEHTGTSDTAFLPAGSSSSSHTCSQLEPPCGTYLCASACTCAGSAALARPGDCDALRATVTAACACRT